MNFPHKCECKWKAVGTLPILSSLACWLHSVFLTTGCFLTRDLAICIMPESACFHTLQEHTSSSWTSQPKITTISWRCIMDLSTAVHWLASTVAVNCLCLSLAQLMRQSSTSTATTRKIARASGSCTKVRCIIRLSIPDYINPLLDPMFCLKRLVWWGKASWWVVIDRWPNGEK